MSSLERKINPHHPNVQVIVKDISFFVNSNATENHEKILDSLKIILPQNFDEKKIIVQNLIGGYNNPIKILTLSINDKDDIDYVIQQFSILLSNSDKQKLSNEFNRRFDEKKIFHFKLKKSSLAKGKLDIFDRSDTIQVSISFSLPMSFKDKTPLIELVEQYLREKKILNVPRN